MDVSDQHSVFFGCMQSAVEDMVMHHDRYEDRTAVLPAEPVRDGSSLVELSDEEEVPLFNRQLEFFQMRQRTGEGETVEQFVDFVKLLGREDLIMFRCLTGVVEELCLRCGAKGHMAAEYSKHKEDVNCDSFGRQGYTRKVGLTSYEEKSSSAPKKRDKTPGPSVWVTKEASKEPWMTQVEDEGDADNIHLVRAAASSYSSTLVLLAMIKQDTTRTVLAAYMVAGWGSPPRRPLPACTRPRQRGG